MGSVLSSISKARNPIRLFSRGLQILENLTHRGAQGCDPCTGDGAGILLQVPHEFFKRAAGDAGWYLPNAGEYGVGMVFLPPQADARQQCEALFSRMIDEEGARLLGWRDVPVKSDAIGAVARSTEPFMRQVFIARDILNEGQFERKLYVIRKRVENGRPRIGDSRARLLLHLQPVGEHDRLQGALASGADVGLLPGLEG